MERRVVVGGTQLGAGDVNWCIPVLTLGTHQPPTYYPISRSDLRSELPVSPTNAFLTETGMIWRNQYDSAGFEGHMLLFTLLQIPAEKYTTERRSGVLSPPSTY